MGNCDCACRPRDHRVERDFVTYELKSADQMVGHWMAGVEAGRSILWDTLGQIMGQVAEDVMGEYEKSLEAAEHRIEKTLDAQVEVLKQNKEAIIAAAADVAVGIEAEARDLSAVQQEALGQNRDG
ncbi:hypothetical protein ACYULU_01630 [Breznakiellaceae bacterium SP9]